MSFTGDIDVQGPVRPRIGPEELAKAARTLVQYKDGKAALETRVVEDELWWELRHWETARKTDGSGRERVRAEPASAWLFNAIANKHADAMDNYPEPVVLPRERSDEDSANVLSSVLPVILENNGFERAYSDSWWEKLKHGTAAYGVFWNSAKENGLGDIDVRPIDLLKLFWEPGVGDIQDSRNLFITELTDTDLLEEQYPEHRGRLGGRTVDVKQYLYDAAVDTGNKSVVVDWYYKLRGDDGRTVLHYAKFVGDVLLFASENDERWRESGWYEHGQYPVVLDVMFPEKGTPAGFGYVSICKDPQMYVDRMYGNILENSMMATKKRFFVSSSTGVNEAEFLDWNKSLVHVEGELDERRIQEITVRPLDGIYASIVQMKIDEMKDTASNRDVNSGGAGSGVTAAAAIAALQEAGNKTSRDMISASYRAYADIARLCVELIRQFYDEERAFRITGTEPGEYSFVSVSNAGLRETQTGSDGSGVLLRRPVFDLKIIAQKKNPFSRAEQNERAKELYGMGFFNPERAQEAMGALEMMDFEGIDRVRDQVRQGQTLLNLCRQMSAQLEQLTAAVAGIPPGAGAAAPMPEPEPGGSPGRSGTPEGREGRIAAAQVPMTGYGQALARRSAPDMSVGAPG